MTDQLEKESAFIKENVSDLDLMHFGKWILLALAIMFVGSWFADPKIFEACKTILPPIATLIIGFYFGKK